MRTATDSPFDEPKVIQELRSQRTPKSPWLSADGRVLVFQRGVSGTEFVLSTRRSRGDRWSTPQVLPMEPDSRLERAPTWPHLTDDGLELWFNHGGNKFDCDIVRATRSSAREPFGNYQFIHVRGQQLRGRTPRYLPETKELFYCTIPSPGDSEDQKLHVLKGFDPDGP